MNPRRLMLVLAVLLCALFVWRGMARHRRRGPVQSPAAAAAVLADANAHPEQSQVPDPLIEALRADLLVYRRFVLLTADEPKLKDEARRAALASGHQLAHERADLRHQLNEALSGLALEPAARRDPAAAEVLDWMESAPEVLELDRLAFRDPLRVLATAMSKDGSPEGARLKARIAEDLAEVDRAEALVEAEYRQSHGASRPRWDAYVAQVRTLVEPLAPLPAAPVLAPSIAEISGTELPEKVLVLSFDDGPHPVYTEEIKAILQRFQAPALFFEVGSNIGSVEPDNAVKLGPLSKLTADLASQGYVIGNHSYTHAQLNKETGKPLDTEIGETDTLLKAIPGAHSHLFRFPYGARGPVQLQAVEAYHLRSVLWNIDSLDWADPVPSSVADRVLKGIAQEKRGIILFHDIHDRAGKVLPDLIPRLREEGYRFAALDGDGNLVAP